MKNRKVSNIFKNWRKAGYDVERINHISRSNELQQCTVHFTKNGQPVQLEDEWAMLRNLADRQRFYCFPIADASDENLSVVHLVPKHKVTNVYTTIKELTKMMKECYWFLQEDKEVNSHINTLTKISESMIVLRDIVRHTNKTNKIVIVQEETLKDFYDSLTLAIRDIGSEINESDKYTFNEKRQIMDFVNDY